MNVFKSFFNRAKTTHQENMALLKAPRITKSPLANEGYYFQNGQVIVSTTFFHWFEPLGGNLCGAWPPIGGRIVWDGSPGYFASQIKEVMLANIDVIYLHMMGDHEDLRLNFFEAYAKLRSEGWDVPKLCPFVDPFYIWRNSPIDLGTTSGKDAFSAEYARFFEQYFSRNTDEKASKFLATIDERLVLATWWVKDLCGDVGALEREDLIARLKEKLADRIPQLDRGIYMITTALIDPDLSFSDERHIMFSGYVYAAQCVHKGLHCWHIQPGYWDQNFRPNGFHLPRNGGKQFRQAWKTVAASMPHIHRIYVESWNEYAESSNICAADPHGLEVYTDMHSNTDTWSDDNNPYEYIDTNAAGAAQVNGRPYLSANIIGYDASISSNTGVLSLSVTVRNEGNGRWTRRHEHAIQITAASGTQVKLAIDPAAQSASVRQGIISRGQPTTVCGEITLAQADLGSPIEIVMTRSGEAISEPCVITADI